MSSGLKCPVCTGISSRIRPFANSAGLKPTHSAEPMKDTDRTPRKNRKTTSSRLYTGWNTRKKPTTLQSSPHCQTWPKRKTFRQTSPTPTVM